MFSTIELVKDKCRQAYPVLQPDGGLPPYELAENLYRANTTEFAIKTIKTEVVDARNISNLITTYLRQTV